MAKEITKYLVLFAVFTILAARQAPANNTTFTISAEVDRSSVIGADINTVMNYIGNADNYTKDFPGVISVKHKSDAIELVYRVDSPLSSPFDITFELTERTENPNNVILESINPDRDYFFSKSSFNELAPSRTSVYIHMKVTITREKASDINFMAGILGEDFISSRMKSKLEGSLETFLSNVQDEVSK